MAKVIVMTDDGREVARFDVPVPYPGNDLWRRMVGRLEAPLGWLGRALSDAQTIEAGGDPERPSERAMRLGAEAIEGRPRPDYDPHLDHPERYGEGPY